MKPDLTSFVLYDRALDCNGEVDFIATIPAGIQNKEMLFEALRHELHLPPYSHNNWDSLSDCLRDLSWINKHRVILIHQDLPSLPRKEILKYLEVLCYAVSDWRPGEVHQLMVGFPGRDKDYITAVISDA